jgi:nitric oxide dioxygenase
VTISAGVGLTPMQAILETLADASYQAPVFYLHACDTKELHSFKRRVDQLSEQMNLTHHTWYNQDHSEEANIHHGLMDLSALEELPFENGDFYLCGPIGFMRFAKHQLINLRVDRARIHYEVFGPHEDF